MRHPAWTAQLGRSGLAGIEAAAVAHKESLPTKSLSFAEGRGRVSNPAGDKTFGVDWPFLNRDTKIYPINPLPTGRDVEVIRVSGYRIDASGIHDRFLRWRHFGYWLYARSVRLEITDTFLKLVITFEGRKKPLKVDLANKFAKALRAATILETGLLHSPSLVLVFYPSEQRYKFMVGASFV